VAFSLLSKGWPLGWSGARLNTVKGADLTEREIDRCWLLRARLIDLRPVDGHEVRGGVHGDGEARGIEEIEGELDGRAHGPAHPRERDLAAAGELDDLDRHAVAVPGELRPAREQDDQGGEVER